MYELIFFFFQAEDGIRDRNVTGVQTCALPIYFELGKRIAECGHRVELIAKPVTMVFPNESMREYFQHELRWSIGLKSVRPMGYRSEERRVGKECRGGVGREQDIVRGRVAEMGG